MRSIDARLGLYFLDSGVHYEPTTVAGPRCLKLPKYLAERYTLGKMIRRNNLRRGHKVVAITKDATQTFFFICEVLGFASFYDVDGDVCLSGGLFQIPNQPFYGDKSSHFQEDEENNPESVFFHRCREAKDRFLAESVRIYEEEMSPIGLSDEGFAALVFSDFDCKEFASH